MTQCQLTLDRDLLQRLFGENEQLRQLLEWVVNQVLEAQVTEHLQAERYERSEARLPGAPEEADDPQHSDELCRATRLPVAEVSGALVMMELKGLARLVESMTYVRAR
jgi:predicted Rossmann fold nucleotide-binding protein DprA/Smf involved in DNA uptake